MSNKSESNVNYVGICNTAIAYAAVFEKNFDYSVDSISELEEILQNHYEDALINHSTDDQLWNIAVILGVYLGQSLLNNALSIKGYQWVLDNGNTPVLMKDKDNIISPVTKTYKRLKNGAEDNVKSFYDVAILIADGKLPSANNQ